MRLSLEVSWRVAFFGVPEGDWLRDWPSSEDAPAFGKRGISPSEGKLVTWFAGVRRLLTRGTSASARSKKARGKASQFDIGTRAPARLGVHFSYSMMQ